MSLLQIFQQRQRKVHRQQLLKHVPKLTRGKLHIFTEKHKHTEIYFIFMVRKIQYSKMSNLPTPSQRFRENSSAGLCRIWQDNSNIYMEEQRATASQHAPEAYSVYLKRLWCWERLKAGGEGDDRGWDGGMALPTQWTWVWVNSGSWWWTGRPGVLWLMGSQNRTWLSDWTELNWLHIFIR